MLGENDGAPRFTYLVHERCGVGPKLRKGSNIFGGDNSRHGTLLILYSMWYRPWYHHERGLANIFVGCPSNAQAKLRGLMISRRAAVSSSLLLDGLKYGPETWVTV
jgi:hypothetical protein